MRPSGDLGRPASATMRVALQTVFNGRRLPVAGSRAIHRTDPKIRALAEAIDGGPLDPRTAEARRVWYVVLRGLIVLDIDLAATAARLWNVAVDEATFNERIACIEDRAWAAYTAGVVELVRGHIVAAEGWFDAADVEAEAQSYPEGRPAWLETIAKELGISSPSFAAGAGSRVAQA
jgi:hypothetical protein